MGAARSRWFHSAFWVQSTDPRKTWCTAEDDSTLVPNGIWTFQYTIRMPETGSGTFDFEHSGRVTIFCGSWDQDWLDGLPPP
jgi:hypothetical protein